jgi:hypothetical protein
LDDPVTSSEWLNTHLTDPAAQAIIALYRALGRNLCAGIALEPALPTIDQLLDRAEFEGPPEEMALYRRRLRAALQPLHLEEEHRRFAANVDPAEMRVKLDGADYGWWKPGEPGIKQP